MPYIAIKAFPKDEETRKKLVEKVNEAVLAALDCPPEAVTISMEEVVPEKWEAEVKQAEIEPKLDKMMILSGKKQY